MNVLQKEGQNEKHFKGEFMNRYVQHSINCEAMIEDSSRYPIDTIEETLKENEMLIQDMETAPERVTLPPTLRYEEALDELRVYNDRLEQILKDRPRNTPHLTY